MYGKKIIAQGGEKKEIKKCNILDLLKSSRKLTSKQILDLVDGDYDLISDVMDSLNPEYNFREKCYFGN